MSFSHRTARQSTAARCHRCHPECDREPGEPPPAGDHPGRRRPRPVPGCRLHVHPGRRHRGGAGRHHRGACAGQYNETVTVPADKVGLKLLGAKPAATPPTGRPRPPPPTRPRNPSSPAPTRSTPSAWRDDVTLDRFHRPGHHARRHLHGAHRVGVPHPQQPGAEQHVWPLPPQQRRHRDRSCATTSSAATTCPARAPATRFTPTRAPRTSESPPTTSRATRWRQSSSPPSPRPEGHHDRVQPPRR